MKLIIDTLHGHEHIDRPLQRENIGWQMNATFPDVQGVYVHLTSGISLYLSADEWQNMIEQLLVTK